MEFFSLKKKIGNRKDDVDMENTQRPHKSEKLCVFCGLFSALESSPLQESNHCLAV